MIPEQCELHLESYTTYTKIQNQNTKRKHTPRPPRPTPHPKKKIKKRERRRWKAGEIFLIKSIEDALFGFFLRLTAARHRKYELHTNPWECFNFVISPLKYLRYWMTNTEKKCLFYDLGEDERWQFGILSYSCSKDLGFIWINCFH